MSELMRDLNIVTLTGQPFAFINRICGARDVGVVVSETFGALSAAFAAARATPGGPPLAHFRPAEGDRVSVDLGFPVTDSVLDALTQAGLYTGETPAGRAMVAVHAGDYQTLTATYEAMIAAIREAGFTPAADTWERYGGEGDAVQVEVIWPLQESVRAA